MIKFFRKIRQNLLSEGKTGKYFKYAIGEIVLVMIGILLALQVNNWNEERKNTSIRKSYLENLKVDLKKDLENLERLNTINTSAETEGFYLADFLDNNLVKVDTLRLMKSIIFTGYIPNNFRPVFSNVSKASSKKFKSFNGYNGYRAAVFLFSIE